MLTQNFTLQELTRTEVRRFQEKNRAEAKRYVPNLVRTAQMLEQVRAVLGGPLIVTSGFRCADLNVAVGGSVLSQHCKGEAADFYGAGWRDEDFKAALASIQNSGIRFNQLLIEAGCLHMGLPYANTVHGEVAYWHAGRKVVMRERLSA